MSWVLAALLTIPGTIHAQHGHGADSARLSVEAMGVAVYSRLSPGALRRDISEAYLTQPMVAARARFVGGRLELRGIVNAEGATLARGEINAGVYGEGYVDRRHPHTWLHEAMIGAHLSSGDVSWSLFAGKGFVPFGTEDPMLRPFVKYPVNHHHAQILERAQISASVSYRGVLLESAMFNGDEPESPTDWPNSNRLFDSRAIRLTVTSRAALALSVSVASVQSPEFASGDGLDQRKRSGSARFRREAGSLRYALVEYANTREFSGSRQAFAFSSVLGEAQWALGPVLLGARAERTERPEEERTSSPYRTVRPLLDFNILGRTRWTNLTLQVAGPPRGTDRVWCRPFVEVGYHVPRAIARPTPLDPVDLFGKGQLWMVSLGLRGRAAKTW
jgi:hypothetical protein